MKRGIGLGSEVGDIHIILIYILIPEFIFFYLKLGTCSMCAFLELRIVTVITTV